MRLQLSTMQIHTVETTSSLHAYKRHFIHGYHRHASAEYTPTLLRHILKFWTPTLVHTPK